MEPRVWQRGYGFSPSAEPWWRLVRVLSERGLRFPLVLPLPFGRMTGFVTCKRIDRPALLKGSS